MSNGKCDAAISPACEGHSAMDRFTSCLMEALYGSNPDEVTGTVDGFGLWAALFLQHETEVVDAGPNHAEVTLPAGLWAVLTENSNGHVHLCIYDTEEEAQEAFDDIDYRYSNWCHGSDFDEYSITSSTGRIGR